MARARRDDPLDMLLGAAEDAVYVGRRADIGALTLRAFAEAPDYCSKALSPAMAALMDAADGNGVRVPDHLARQLFRCEPNELPRRGANDQRYPVRVVCLSAGGRGGKTSHALAPKALHAAWTTPLRAYGAPADPRYPNAQMMAPGERAEALLIAPKKKLAKKAFSFVRGLVLASPVLSRALVSEPTSESLVLRRPDGIEVLVEVRVAGAKGDGARGGSLVFCGLEEACFFLGDGYTVNDEDVFSAAFPRVVPYGQVWIVSTPWIEGDGLLERLIRDNWGTHEHALVAARVGTRTLNPSWDPDGSIEAMERRRPGGEQNADREILAIPLPRGTRGLFSPAAVARALTRPNPPGEPAEKACAADFAHTSDASAFAAAARWDAGMFGVLRRRAIISRENQKPSATYAAFAEEALSLGVTSIMADGHYKEAVKEEWRKRRIRYVDAPAGPDAKPETYLATVALLEEDRLCLGSLPAEDREEIAEQLATVVAKPLSGGRVQIIARRRRVSEMGVEATSHADDVSALVLALWQVGAGEPRVYAETKPKVHRLERGGGARRGAYPGSRDAWR